MEGNSKGGHLVKRNSRGLDGRNPVKITGELRGLGLNGPKFAISDDILIINSDHPLFKSMVAGALKTARVSTLQVYLADCMSTLGFVWDYMRSRGATDEEMANIAWIPDIEPFEAMCLAMTETGTANIDEICDRAVAEKMLSEMSCDAKTH